VSLKDALAVRSTLLENATVNERQAKIRYEAGTAPKLDLLRAQTERAGAEHELRLAEQAYATARIALATLLDHSGDFEVVAPSPVPVDPASLASEDGRQRPDVLAAQLSNRLAQKARTATYFKYLPNVVGSATYQLSNVGGFSNSTGQWAVGVAASWTLWDGGAREVELAENASKEREATAALHAAERKARDEIRSAAFDLESARANIGKAEEQAKLARETLQLVTATYEAGTSTQLDVSNVRAALAGAELALVVERTKREVSALRLLKAAGR